MKFLRKHKLLLIFFCFAVGVWVSFEIWVWTEPTSRMTSTGGTPDAAACNKARADAAALTGTTDASRLEVQRVIQAAANTCIGYESAPLVAELCRAYPDACTGKLEEELR